MLLQAATLTLEVKVPVPPQHQLTDGQEARQAHHRAAEVTSEDEEDHLGEEVEVASKEAEVLLAVAEEAKSLTWVSCLRSSLW